MMRSNINISPSSCDPSPSRFSSLPEEIYLAIVSSLDAVSVVSLSKKNPFSPFRFASGMETCGRDSGVSRGLRQLLIGLRSQFQEGDSKEKTAPLIITQSSIHPFKLSYEVDGSTERGAAPFFTKLLPGGRWFVGCALYGGHARMFCWDLHSRENAIEIPVAHIDSHYGAIAILEEEIHIQPCDDYAHIAILLPYKVPGPTRAELRSAVEVLHLSWLPDGNPGFKRAQVLFFGDGILSRSFSLDGEVALIYTASAVRVWHWRNDPERIIEHPTNHPEKTLLRFPFLLKIPPDDNTPISFEYIGDPSAVIHVGERPSLFSPASHSWMTPYFPILDLWTPPSDDRLSYLALTPLGDGTCQLTLISEPSVRLSRTLPPQLAVEPLHHLGSDIPRFPRHHPLPGQLGIMGWDEWVWPEEPTTWCSSKHVRAGITFSQLQPGYSHSIGLTITIPSLDMDITTIDADGNEHLLERAKRIGRMHLCTYSGLLVVQTFRGNDSGSLNEKDWTVEVYRFC